MEKFVEKLIDRLEEERNKAGEKFNNYLDNENLSCIFDMSDIAEKRLNTLNDAISIVNELAEEYKGGWTPCSERLPEDDTKQYIVQKTNGFIDILGFTKDAYKLDKYDFAEYKGKKKQLFYDYDSEYGYIEYECEAWMPLPEPYKGE